MSITQQVPEPAFAIACADHAKQPTSNLRSRLSTLRLTYAARGAALLIGAIAWLDADTIRMR